MPSSARTESFVTSRVALLQAALYAPKSEKSKDLHQGTLPLPIVRIAESKPEGVAVVEVPARTRAKRGRKPLPDHLLALKSSMI